MKIINSPIFIAILIIISAFILKSQSKPDIASKMENAYDTLISIAEDLNTDTEKTKIIQNLSEQLASQLKDGFVTGILSTSADNRSKEFLRERKNIYITDVKEVQSEWEGSQSILFKIENKSEFAITNIKVNIEFFRNGELIDVKNQYIHEIKVLNAGENFIVKTIRRNPDHLSEEEKANNTFDEVKATVTSFEISK